MFLAMTKIGVKNSSMKLIMQYSVLMANFKGLMQSFTLSALINSTL